MQITRLLFVETGTYNDMAMRPYVSNATPQTVMQIQEATHGGSNLTVEALSGVAGQILRPSTEAQGIVSIANSWDTPRFRFFMEVVESGFQGGETVQYMTGYTDYVGVSHMGSVDPNMRLFFNNSIRTRRMTITTPLGRETQQAVSDASHVLSGNYTPSLNNINMAVHTMRPEDVFKTIGATAMLGAVIDTRTTFAPGNLKKSRRSNGAAATYLSRVMTAHQNTMAQIDPDDGFQHAMQKAAGTVRESLVASDPFLAYAIRNTSLSEGTSMTYGELLQMQPGLDDQVVVALARGVAAASNHNRGSTEYWNGTTNETIFATILSHSVPAIMTDLMLSKVAFMATNQTLANQFHVQFADVQSLAQNIDLAPYVQMFQHRLLTEILNDLTQGGNIAIQLIAEFDLLGETKIQISANGGPMVPYCTPSFCDALMAPVLTNNAQNLQVMAHDISALNENMQVDLSVEGTGYSQTSTPSYQELFTNGHSSSV